MRKHGGDFVTRWGLALPMAGLLLGACASVPTPVTRSPKSPAHPEAPEAVTPPADAVLMAVDDDAAPPPVPAPPKMEMDMHEGHVMPPPSPSQVPRAMDMPGSHVMPSPAPSPTPETSAALYTCPMHPKVKADKPGTCPVCGMTLVRKKPEGPKQ